MTGQNGNGTEEVEANDLNKEDSKLAASYQSVEDFEGPGPTGQNENETEEVGANDLNKEDRKLAASYQSVEDFEGQDQYRHPRRKGKSRQLVVRQRGSGIEETRMKISTC